MTEPETTRRTPWLKIAGTAVVLTGLIVAIAYTASTSRAPSAPAAEAPPAATSFLIGGTLELRGSSGIDTSNGTARGSSCFGRRGYDDIGPTTQVTVTAGGEVVALGLLGLGKYDGGVCTFPISVNNVPVGHDFYSVEVSHRGEINYPADALKRPISVTLG